MLKMKSVKRSYNDITSLPEELGQLKQLRQLGLGRNQLQRLPDISDLEQLRILTLFDNSISELDESIGKLLAVEKLDFSSNAISKIHYSIYQLPALTYLNLRRNKLRKLDQLPIECLLETRHSQEMVIIDLSWNQLQSIPYRFTLMGNWQLRLNKNPFDKPLIATKIQAVPECLKSIASRAIYRQHLKANRVAVDRKRLVQKLFASNTPCSL